MSDQLLLEGNILEATRDGSSQIVEIDLIRQGFGNPRDRHYYSDAVLESYAQMFDKAKMYIDHQDPETARRLQGLPRSVREVGGRIIEAWVDTNAEGKKVIRGKAKIAQPWLWQLIEADPELLGVSINARGQSREGMIEGQKARIVESINRVLSVDFVTEAGAGGKINALVEAQMAAIEESDEDDETMATAADDDTDASAETTEETEEQPAEADEPDTAEETGDGPEETSDEDETTESLGAYEIDDDEWAAFLAEEGVEEGEVGKIADDEDIDFSEFDAELDAEDDTEEAVYTEADLEARAEELAAERLEEAVRAAVEVAREQYNTKLQEAKAEFDRRVAQIEQRFEAARIIDGAGFKPRTTAALKEEFYDAYFEGEFDAEGVEVKSPLDALKEAVKRAIDDKRRELSDYVEGHSVTGAGETGSPLTEAGHEPGGPVPKRAPADEELNRLLGIG